MADDPLIGQQLDEYRIEALLGQGGMARVYQGFDTRLERWVAIKVIEASFQDDADYMVRFEREAKAIAQLEHPHIVSVYRYGEANGVLYMAMRYIEGSALDRMLATYHREGDLMPVAEARRVVQQICLALDYAHKRGVIHRDVKPGNIMIDQQGNAYLADFGLALLTHLGTRGEIFGTPHYIAPEQAISSAGAGPQSDLYAMGVILFEMFTGQVPFEADSAMDVAMMHMTEPPPRPRQLRPDLSPELEAVILKALEKEPVDRYPSGTALVAALDQALKAGVQVSLPLPPSHKSILQRVAVDLAERPLPPLPPGVSAPPPAAPIPSRADKQPAMPAISTPIAAAKSMPQRQRSLLFAGLGVGVLALMGLVGLILLVGLLFFLRSGSQQSASPAIELTAPATPVAGDSLPAVATETATAVSVPSPSPQAVAATILPPAAPTLQMAASSPEPPESVEATPTPAGPITYHLMIATRGEDSLMIINRGDQPLPLANLQLLGERGEIQGSAWGNVQLGPEDCVSLIKDKGKPKKPDGSCREIGEQQIEAKTVFWKEGFDVYYAGQPLAQCEQERCEITFQVTSDQGKTQVQVNDQDREEDNKDDDD